MTKVRIAHSQEDLGKYLRALAVLLLENLLLNLPDEGWTIEDATSQVENLLLNLKEGNAQLFLAEDEEHLLGFAWTYKRRLARKERLHINHIIVQSGHRNEGIGQRILSAIILEAKELKVDSIDLMSNKDREEVVRFYSKNGFSVERLQMVYKLPEG